ncbi:MAG: histidine kinase, partial [Flavobacteriales bacterium]|nr:histidine kinase [Flavobacteriales bacterium]
MRKQIFIILLLLVTTLRVGAQYPHYFSYDNENGLPSNEVYSIIQDEKGFIWIGCDAGLFKYDGIRYTPYKCDSQKAKSITGLTNSASGRTYCFNFRTQMFYLENDTLKELEHQFENMIINNLVSDVKGNIYMVHEMGIMRYNELKQQWNEVYGCLPDYENGIQGCGSKSPKGSLQEEINFICQEGVIEPENDKIRIVQSSDLFRNVSTANYELEQYHNSLWIFGQENGEIYQLENNFLGEISNSQLNKILQGRKITNVRALTDGNLWISTYKGMIKFNLDDNQVELYYPEFSFTDCIIDGEGSYWFTTLHNGILRIPDLSLKVWNEHLGLTKIARDSSHIYYASVSGNIGQLNEKTKELKSYHTDNDADVQSLDYDYYSNTLWFNINSRLYGLHNDQLTERTITAKAIKSYQLIDSFAFTLSSHGIFINDEKVNYYWARQLKYDQKNESIWIATNNGVYLYNFIDDHWKQSQHLFENTQILSIDLDPDQHLLYALSFNGDIHLVDTQYNTSTLTHLPETVQGTKLIYEKEQLYLATNRGIAILDLDQDQLIWFNLLSGLVSNNVQDIIASDSNIWVATTKGLQVIPLNRIIQDLPLAKIYLKENSRIDTLKEINFNEAIILYPEACIYSSNGQFEYAYRLNKSDWIKLPSNIEQIEIQNIPSGNYEIELKVIDHLGRDSENIIKIKGYVNPPFWQKWWFAGVIVILFLLIVWFIFRRRVQILRLKQLKEIERIQLENELRLSRETALKSQMNPHFVFNVMNTIKAYIYKNDKQTASEYLNKFSGLLRNFLSMSGKPMISLADEFKMLDQYISMEAMMLGDDFSYQLHIDEAIDLQHTKIPSLIVQPYVENAFKHGLHSKIGQKILTIGLQIENEDLVVLSISDNGIGRKAAQLNKEAANLQHESFATNSIEKRIELLNRN